MPAAAFPQAKAIAEAIKKQDDKHHFVTDVIKKAGYPRWDKARIINNINRTVSGRRTSDSIPGEVVYVPFVLDSGSTTNAMLSVAFDGPDTTYRIAYARGYRLFGYDTSDSNAWNARKAFVLFAGFDYTVFGHTKFSIKDTLLFPGSANRSNITATLKERNGQPLNGRTANYSYDCWSVTICWDINAARTTSFRYCQDYNGCAFTDDGSGSSGGTPTGGGWTPSSGSGTGVPPSGGSGGSGGWWSGGGTYPCPAVVQRSSVIAPVDCTTGWTPIVNNNPPYVCNYAMTQHDRDVFAQIDQEDQVDNNNANLDCQGTGRSGNIQFPGTREHWLIQLDYIIQNPVFGRREFAVPNGSITNPANRGYADVVNLQNGNMFEIKPNNFLGGQNGAAEVANYVSKANLNCTGTLPVPHVWNEGSSYATRYIPLNNQGTSYVEAKLISPGVIGYNQVGTPNPVPVPVAIPSSVYEKFKKLFDRLRQNFSNADRIIAEYFNDPQNADVLNYIKAAALGAGVAIVVGTILEDVVTAGAGIADDWACFVLAWRIVRFAL